MCEYFPATDGLLLLLQAAKKIEEGSLFAKTNNSHSLDKRERFPIKSTHEDKFTNSCSPLSCTYHGQKRGLHHARYNDVPSSVISNLFRCSHNELEKTRYVGLVCHDFCRRAHLRNCMDTLKSCLDFETNVPRITMLAVLKRAKCTILDLVKKNQTLKSREESEKQRYARLVQRRRDLKKKNEVRRNRSIKLQSWRERNRNYSECSIATTSSDDSELEALRVNPSQTGYFNPSDGTTQINVIASNETVGTDLVNTWIPAFTSMDSYKSIPASHPISLGTTRSPSLGLDAFDGSSSDSGYEEIAQASGDFQAEQADIYDGRVSI